MWRSLKVCSKMGGIVKWLFVVQLCPTLFDPMDCSTPGFPVLHYLLDFAQTHVYWVSDAIQASYHLSPPSAALNLSQHQGVFPVSQLFTAGGQSIGASASATVFSINIQDWFPLGLTGLISLQSIPHTKFFGVKNKLITRKKCLWKWVHVQSPQALNEWLCVSV